MRNIYDNSEFFAAYAEMGRSKDGLKAAGEWHQLQPLFPNQDKPEKLFLFSTPCVILKKKGVFICYSLINTLIKFMASLPVMTA